MTSIALIGGSFNPPTISHALMGLEILRVCAFVDEVWYVPSNHHPHADRHPSKAARPPFEERVAWVRAMVEDLQAQTRGVVRVCDIESQFTSPCYAKDVLEMLQRICRDHTFYWVIGSDCFEDLHTWMYYEWLAEHVTFIVYPRPGYSGRRQELLQINQPATVKTLVLTPQDVIVSNVSSTFVRNNPDASWAMTPGVAACFRERT